MVRHCEGSVNPPIVFFVEFSLQAPHSFPVFNVRSVVVAHMSNTPEKLTDSAAKCCLRLL